MNSVNLIGRHTRDPELRYTQSGTAVINGNLAVNRNFKNANGEYEADFIQITAWRKTAELIAEHFRKGDMIGVSGRIQTRNYENNDGQRVYVTEVVVENITFLPKKNQSGGKPSKQDIDPYKTDDPFASDGDTIDISDDDLPF